MNDLLLRLSQKFAARAAHYRSLACAEPDEHRAEVLFGISALFLEMATNMADREMAISYPSAKYRIGVIQLGGWLWRSYRSVADEKLSIRTFAASKADGTDLVHEKPIHQAITSPGAPAPAPVAEDLKSVCAAHLYFPLRLYPAKIWRKPW
jgi:hypothetical protein